MVRARRWLLPRDDSLCPDARRRGTSRQDDHMALLGSVGGASPELSAWLWSYEREGGVSSAKLWVHESVGATAVLDARLSRSPGPVELL
jgi:hypothetical protein